MEIGAEPSEQVQRTMSLLWQQPSRPTRGPKPGLTVGQVIDAAVAVADEEGALAVSMRAVAIRLGRSPMSLYTYVPGKAELQDLMLDRVLGELLVGRTASGWRAGLEHAAWDMLRMYIRHPWVLEVSENGATLGPGELAVFEQQLGLVDGLGLGHAEMGLIIGAVGNYVRGAAEGVVRAHGAVQDGAAAERLRERAMAVIQLLGEDPVDRFPLLARMGVLSSFAQPPPEPLQAHSPDEEEAAWADGFAFGLHRLLDGIELIVPEPAGSRGADER